MINSELLRILVCPMCKGKLKYNKTLNELICIFDNVAYAINDEIPIMLKHKSRKLT